MEVSAGAWLHCVRISLCVATEHGCATLPESLVGVGDGSGQQQGGWSSQPTNMFLHGHAQEAYRRRRDTLHQPPPTEWLQQRAQRQAEAERKRIQQVGGVGLKGMAST